MANIIQLSSTTVENALFEAASYVQGLERSPDHNPQNKNYVNVTIDTDTAIATITARLPIFFNVNARGGLTVSISEYLT